MSLFTAIATKKISNWSQITEEEQKLTQNTFDYYLEKMNQRNIQEEIISKQKTFLLEQKDSKIIDLFEVYERQSLNLYDTAIKGKIDDWVRTLNQTYNILVKFEQTPDLNSAEDLLNFYFKSGNITSLKDKSINEIKEKFKSQITNRWGVKTEVKNTTIIFKNYYYVEKNYYDKIVFKDYDISRQFDVLIRALSLFEIGETNYIKNDIKCKFDWIDYNKELYTDEQYFESCRKLSKVKLFKNGNIKLTFHSSENVHQFLEFFELYNEN